MQSDADCVLMISIYDITTPQSSRHDRQSQLPSPPNGEGLEKQLHILRCGRHHTCQMGQTEGDFLWTKNFCTSWITPKKLCWIPAWRWRKTSKMVAGKVLRCRTDQALTCQTIKCHVVCQKCSWQPETDGVTCDPRLEEVGTGMSLAADDIIATVVSGDFACAASLRWPAPALPYLGVSSLEIAVASAAAVEAGVTLKSSWRLIMLPGLQPQAWSVRQPHWPQPSATTLPQPGRI